MGCLQLTYEPILKIVSEKEHKQTLGRAKNRVKAYQYKYNGKELQDELGLNMYAMDARLYDPAIGRWTVQDPITHHSMSPYNAFDGNPVYWADPSGADAVYNWDTGKYMDGDKEVSFETAMGQQGLNSNGSKKSNEKSDPGRRRGVRQRSDNRGRSTSGSLVFDARGQELLSHWLNGSGKNLELSGDNWQEYMKENGILSEQIEGKLLSYLSGIREMLKTKGKPSTIDLKFHGEIENGYFTGYEMLHGSNSKLGDTQIKGTVEYNSKTSQFDFNIQVIWNDKIDPNASYDEDVMLNNLLNVFYTPKDYNVKIKWNEKVSVK
jgi:RHS repeat-associated protein